MLSILKTFGMGLLYTILSPFILLILIFYFIYTLLAFIIMFLGNIFLFFKGQSITDELEIDKQARKILEAQNIQEEKFKEAVLKQLDDSNSSSNNENNDTELKRGDLDD